MSINRDLQKADELLDAQRYSEALKYYNRALESEPANPDIYSRRGVNWFHLQNLKNALKDMNKAVDLEPDYSYRYASRAYIKDAMGDLKGAIADYQKAVELDPEDAVTLNNLGLLEEKAGYDKSARRHFDLADALGMPEPKDSVEIKPRNIQKEHETEQQELQKKGRSGIMIQAVTSRKTFVEFIRFVGRGWRKERDQGS
jgi:tetratricopeptide (TPR) repeat protein